MAIEIDKLAKDMLGAALDVLKDKGRDALSFAGPEMQKIALTVVSIETDLNAGRITEEQARLLFEMQKNATRSVLLAVEGIGLLAAEGAINAALAVARPIVNGALKFALL